MEDDVILQLLKQQQLHGNRHRLRAVSALQAQHPEYSGRRFQKLANELRLRLLRGERKSMLSVEYCEAHLIWSMDIFEQVHRGVRFHVLQVIDLGSRMKLEPVIKPGAFTGEEVAEHLNYLMHKHEVPLFLKRDNGSNLNSSEVLSDFKNVRCDSLQQSAGISAVQRGNGAKPGGNQTLFACDPERPGATGFIRRSSTFICRTSQSAQARCSGGKERMGALERGVSALHQAGTGKCLSGNQASGGMDFGDISQEKTTKERRGRACLENRNTALFGKQRIHQAFS